MRMDTSIRMANDLLFSYMGIKAKIGFFPSENVTVERIS